MLTVWCTAAEPETTATPIPQTGPAGRAFGALLLDLTHLQRNHLMIAAAGLLHVHLALGHLCFLLHHPTAATT